MWFLNQLEPDSAVYNISVAVHLEGSLDVLALKRSYAHLLERNQCLRASITSVDGTPVQVLLPTDRFELAVVDLAGLAPLQRTRRSMERPTYTRAIALILAEVRSCA